MTGDEIFAGVRECLVRALACPAAQVRPAARLVGDLGADSLDLLDLVFQLEQHFHIRITPRGIELRARAALGDRPFEVEGVYTPEALAKLREALPEIPVAELAPGLTTQQLPRLFRVQTFVNLVARLLDEKARGEKVPDA